MTAPGGFVSGDILSATDMNALPAGVVGYATVTSSQGSITSVADITSLTVTWTAVSSRLYKTTLFLPMSSTSAAEEMVAYVTDSSNVVKQQGTTSADTADVSEAVVLVGLETGLSGSVTRKARASASAGGAVGTITAVMSTTAPGVLIVEDIGPA